MKLYSDISHYTRAHRGELADILKPYWKDISDAERRTIYGAQVDQYEVVDSVAEADICVLPMSWNYYKHTRQVDRALAFIEQARAHHKDVATWVTGDFGVTVPVEDVYIFRASGYRSKRAARQFAVPVLIRDPLIDYGRQNGRVRRKAARPLVGFCGQASDSFVAKLAKPLRLALRNIRYHLGASPHEPQHWVHPTFVRARVLSVLEKSSYIETQFIKREKYRGGAKASEKISQNLRTEFLDNIADTDYTVCIRGSGNFSARLYEVLAMGRIPIFVDTDCLLPYQDMIDWTQYCVWVDQSEIAHLPEKVVEFHDSLSDRTFMSLQERCRKLWEDRLSFAGFFTHFPEHFRL